MSLWERDINECRGISMCVCEFVYVCARMRALTYLCLPRTHISLFVVYLCVCVCVYFCVRACTCALANLYMPHTAMSLHKRDYTHIATRTCGSELQRCAACCNVLQRVVACCSASQCAAACRSVLQ